MKTPNGKYSCKNGYLQIVIHRGRASACGEKFTVMTACNTFGKRPCGWGAQKPCVIRAEARIDFTSLTRSVFTCSKRLLFEQPYYRKFTVTCGCNPLSLACWEPVVTGSGLPGVHAAPGGDPDAHEETARPGTDGGTATGQPGPASPPAADRACEQ